MMVNQSDRRRKPKPEIFDPYSFYRQGLGPGYPEEEFGSGDTGRDEPEKRASIRNRRGDRYSRFDRPGRNNPGISQKR